MFFISYFMGSLIQSELKKESNETIIYDMIIDPLINSFLSNNILNSTALRLLSLLRLTV